jgi:hypothetical protein
MKDLRHMFDESTPVMDGTLYRKGGTIQVWWTQDAIGRPFYGSQGRETWELPDSQWGIEEAKRNFNDMKERFNPAKSTL